MHNSVSAARPQFDAAQFGLVRSTEATDPFLQAASLAQWSQEYTQLTSGQFLGRTVDLSLGSVQVFREAMTQAVDQKCLQLGKSYTIGISFQPGGNWQNRPLDENSIFLLPPGEETRLKTPQNSDIIVAVIDHMELQRQAEQRLDIDADALFKGSLVHTLNVAAATEFRAKLNRFLLFAQDAPEALAYGDARRRMVDGILATCLQALSHGSVEGQSSRDGHRVHRAIVERARECILSNPGAPPTVADLCTYLNMSQRGLHYAFMQVLDINPVTFIRNVRLHAVRRLLLQGTVSVSAAAQQWGFWHMSMFSCYYKGLFGELPSETSRKSPQLRPARWLSAV